VPSRWMQRLRLGGKAEGSTSCRCPHSCTQLGGSRTALTCTHIGQLSCALHSIASLRRIGRGRMEAIVQYRFTRTVVVSVPVCAGAVLEHGIAARAARRHRPTQSGDSAGCSPRLNEHERSEQPARGLRWTVSTVVVSGWAPDAVVVPSSIDLASCARARLQRAGGRVQLRSRRGRTMARAGLDRCRSVLTGGRTDRRTRTKPTVVWLTGLHRCPNTRRTQTKKHRCQWATHGPHRSSTSRGWPVRCCTPASPL
jgi:hypothetical protein